MKKETKKYLIIILVIVLVLGGAIAALMLTDDTATAESSSSASSEAGISLTAYTEDEVASVEVVRRDDEHSYKILMSTDDGGVTTYAMDGVSEVVPISSAKMKVIAKCGYLLTANKDLGETENFGEYGLDDPQLIIKTVLKDGTAFNYLVGNETPSGGYYIVKEGENQLYTADLNANLFKNQLELVDNNILTVGDPTAIASGSAANTYTYAKISGKNYEEPIELDNNAENSYAVYQLLAPEALAGSACDENIVSILSTALNEVDAERVAVINPTAEDLKAYGLDEPAAIIHFRANDETEGAEAVERTLSAGTKTEDALYPVMIDGVPVIYLVKESTISVWYDAAPFSFRSTLILLPNIQDIKAVSLKNAEISHTFTITRTLNEEKSTEEEPVYDSSVVGTKNQELTYKTFQKFYQQIIGVQLLEESYVDVSGSPYLTISYRYEKGGSDMIAFYQMEENPRQCYVAVNGKVCGTTKVTVLDSIITSAAEMEEDRNTGA